MKSVLRLYALSAAAVVLTGCGTAANINRGALSSPTPTAARVETPTPPLNNEPAATPNAVPADEGRELRDTAFEGTAGLTEKKNAGGQLAVMTAVRTGQHPNFDRIVFEFAGDSLPGYRIEYVDKPVRQCGSGEVVPLAGDAWLEIRFEPANAHSEDGKPTVGNRALSPNQKIVREMKLTCDFEAQVEWVAGVSSPNRYRVLELKNPTRLVVDIRH